MAIGDDDPARTLEHFRHRTLAELEHQLSREQLSRSEYDRRVALALQAHSPADLRPLVSDLILAEPARAVRQPDDAEDSGFALALMSSSVRDGQWRPPDTVVAFSIMGHVLLDFRDAQLLEGTTTVHTWAVMGGITVVVPPDVHLSVGGFGLLGGFGRTRHTAALPDAPRIDVVGLALMGGVDVKVREPGVDLEAEQKDREKKR